MSSFFRYPGGKSKLSKHFISHLSLYNDDIELQYREPFVGGGGIVTEFAKANPDWYRYWINDFDPALVALWNAVIKYPEELKEEILAFTPTVDAYDNIKAKLLATNKLPKQKAKVVDLGAKKLQIHQISFSGLGTKSGGPLGGRSQESKYPIDCRWTPKNICKKIDRLHNVLQNFELQNNCCTNHDFQELIDHEGVALLYLDPPYYVKGGDLYQHSFSQEDHERLAQLLKETDHYWILSYDDCPEVRHLYDWAYIEEIDVNYTLQQAKATKGAGTVANKKVELLIYSDSHRERLCSI